jgi:hypothetical protein
MLVLSYILPYIREGFVKEEKDISGVWVEMVTVLSEHPLVRGL